MRIPVLICLIPLFTTPAFSDDFTMKPGKWQFTTTTTMPGMNEGPMVIKTT